MRVVVRETQTGSRNSHSSGGELPHVSYVLWPFEDRGSKKGNAKRNDKLLAPGTVRFRLTIEFPAQVEQEIRQAVAAWLAFGGYGARTRRGAGSLVPIDEAQRKEWCPQRLTAKCLRELLGADVFSGKQKRCDLPTLAGATLLARPGVGGGRKATQAWPEAIEYLQRFRTGGGADPKSGAGAGACPGMKWPEAGLAKRFQGDRPKGRRSDEPRPTWPRADFGLPLQLRLGRDTLTVGWWKGGGNPSTRLASPVIVKAVGTAEQGFVPAVLVLDRDYPSGAKVGIVRKDRKGLVPCSSARFRPRLSIADRQGKGNSQTGEPVDQHKGAVEAFVAWLKSCGWRQVAP